MAGQNVAGTPLENKIPQGTLSTLTPDNGQDPILLLWEAKTRLEALLTIARSHPRLFLDELALGGLLMQLDDADSLLGMSLETLSAGKVAPDYLGIFKG